MWVLLHKLFWFLLSPALELLQLVFTSAIPKFFSKEVTPVGVIYTALWRLHSVIHNSHCSGKCLTTDMREKSSFRPWDSLAAGWLAICVPAPNVGLHLPLWRRRAIFHLLTLRGKQHSTTCIHLTKFMLPPKQGGLYILCVHSYIASKSRVAWCY